MKHTVSDPAPGIYRAVGYQSGTVTVEDGKLQQTKYGVRNVNPHLSVYGPTGTDDDWRQRQRWEMASELAAWLNGAERPWWLNDMVRVDEETMVSAEDGSELRATGPFIDVRPPHCHWEQDNRDSARNRRARLMDAVQGIGR